MAFKVSDVLPDPILTRLAVEFGTGGPYIADLIAPVARVQADSYKFATFGREDIKADTKATRAPGVGAARVAFTKSYTAGAVQYRSLKSDIPDEVRQNDPNGDGLDARRVKVLTNKLRLEIEVTLAAILAAATKTHTAPSPKWDAANATIRKDILAAREAFRKNAGMYPNVLVLPPNVANAVFNDDAILNLLRYTDGKILEGGAKRPIEGMQVVVPGAIIDSANPGAAASIADVWSAKEAYYLYVDQTAGDDLAAMTAIRQIRSLATGGQAFVASRWRDPDVSAKTDWVSVEVNQNEHVLAQEFILRHQAVLT